MRALFLSCDRILTVVGKAGLEPATSWDDAGLSTPFPITLPTELLAQFVLFNRRGAQPSRNIPRNG